MRLADMSTRRLQRVYTRSTRRAWGWLRREGWRDIYSADLQGTASHAKRILESRGVWMP